MFAQTSTTRTAHGRCDTGFSLMEILIALGIFAIGLVAVAAVFPTAIAVQSETVRDLAGQRVAMSARAQIQALAASVDPNETNPPSNSVSLTYKHDPNPALREGTLRDFTVPLNRMWNQTYGRTGYPGGVQPMIDQPTWLYADQVGGFYNDEFTPTALNAAKSFHFLFNDEVRSYPKTIADPLERDYYWFPLIQPRSLVPTDPPTWIVYLMVMQRSGTEKPPQVRAWAIDPGGSNGRVIALDNSVNYLDNDMDTDGLPDLIQPGDQVLDSRGTIHRVVVADRYQITVDSPVPTSYSVNDVIYFPVALNSAFNVKRESRSAIVRIEQFELLVNEPSP